MSKELIGRTGIATFGGLSVEVKVTAIKCAYGKTRVQVEPVCGGGSAWVLLSSVSFEDIPDAGGVTDEK